MTQQTFQLKLSINIRLKQFVYDLYGIFNVSHDVAWRHLVAINIWSLEWKINYNGKRIYIYILLLLLFFSFIVKSQIK